MKCSNENSLIFYSLFSIILHFFLSRNWSYNLSSKWFEYIIIHILVYYAECYSSKDRHMILATPMIFTFNGFIVGFIQSTIRRAKQNLLEWRQLPPTKAMENRSGAKWRMTIAEAGSVGRIKHNFSVMVRGVGFSTLIISSTSQSRPCPLLARPPPASLTPRSRVFSLYLSVARYRYTTLAPGNTFPCIFLGHSPRAALSPSALPLPSSACASTVCSPPYNFRRSPGQLSLRLALFIYLSLPRFFALLCRALITNFSPLS